MAANETAVATPGYKADSIQVLKGLEAVRKRPGMYIGSTGENGLHHLVYEVVDNSIDEALAGYCDRSASRSTPTTRSPCTDNGRGIPVDIHPTEKIPGVELALTVLHAGGKFDKSTYKVSGGLHGVGVSVVNALSERLEVWSTATADRHQMAFVRGQTTKKLSVLGKAQGHRHHGHASSPTPRSSQVLEFNYSTLADRLRQLAFLNKGVTITLQGRAHGPDEGGEVLREGRAGPVRRVAQPEQEGAAPQADRLHRHQGRRRGGHGAAVRGRVQREHLHLREQHQHPRGRHPPDGLQVGADAHHQRRGEASRLPQEGRLHPLGRRRARGPDVRAARQGAASRSSRGRPRPSSATPRSRASSRRW